MASTPKPALGSRRAAAPPVDQVVCLCHPRPSPDSLDRTESRGVEPSLTAYDDFVLTPPRVHAVGHDMEIGTSLIAQRIKGHEIHQGGKSPRTRLIYAYGHEPELGCWNTPVSRLSMVSRLHLRARYPIQTRRLPREWMVMEGHGGQIISLLFTGSPHCHRTLADDAIILGALVKESKCTPSRWSG